MAGRHFWRNGCPSHSSCKLELLLQAIVVGAGSGASFPHLLQPSRLPPHPRLTPGANHKSLHKHGSPPMLRVSRTGPHLSNHRGPERRGGRGGEWIGVLTGCPNAEPGTYQNAPLRPLFPHSLCGQEKPEPPSTLTKIQKITQHKTVHLTCFREADSWVVNSTRRLRHESQCPDLDR